MKSTSRKTPEIPIPGMVAVSAMLITLTGSLLFVLVSVMILVFKFEFGDDSLALLAMGSALLFLGLVSSIGLAAALVNIFTDKQNGLVSFSLIVNGLVLVLITGLIVVNMF